MKNLKLLIIFGLVLLLGQFVNGQATLNSDSTYKAGTPLSGRLWGFVFGDYFYKGHSDSLNRGGANQYTGLSKDDNAFALKRAYLAYDFNINKKFSTHMILAAENWNQSSNLNVYLKVANFKWKNLWKGTDLTVGLQFTPAYVGYSESVWSYRSIEKTISDIRGTLPYDLGVSLKGTFDASENFGYHVMVGNGRGAKAENNRFKNVYGNVYGLFLDKKIMVNLYADYERLDWKPGFHHSQNMVKLFVGYTGKNIAAGVEGFLRYGKQDLITTSMSSVDTVGMNSYGLSFFLRGNIISEKLGYFARMDIYNPYLEFENNKIYSGLSARYNPNVKEQFVTFGLDYTPVKGIHIMPNVWYNSYRSQYDGANGVSKFDFDLVYRLSFHFAFGKN